MVLTDFTQLEAWKKAMDLAGKIHDITSKFPKDELYGLVSQMRKAAVSVISNIAEGFGRYTYPDKKNKYVQSRGELVELMSQIYYSERVGYINNNQCQELIADCKEVQKLLNGLITKMKKLDS